MTAPDRQEMDSKIRKRSVMIAGHATSVSLEAAFVSDETFLSEFFRSETERSKPYESAKGKS